MVYSWIEEMDRVTLLEVTGITNSLSWFLSFRLNCRNLISIKGQGQGLKIRGNLWIASTRKRFIFLSWEHLLAHLNSREISRRDKKMIIALLFSMVHSSIPASNRWEATPESLRTTLMMTRSLIRVRDSFNKLRTYRLVILYREKETLKRKVAFTLFLVLLQFLAKSMTSIIQLVHRDFQLSITQVSHSFRQL
jgi:hypothetical protein